MVASTSRAHMTWLSQHPALEGPRPEEAFLGHSPPLNLGATKLPSPCPNQLISKQAGRLPSVTQIGWRGPGLGQDFSFKQQGRYPTVGCFFCPTRLRMRAKGQGGAEPGTAPARRLLVQLWPAGGS